jgi:DNA polymerase III delta' subunit
MAFKDVLGNEQVKKTLRIALEKSRVPNSLLLCGQEGVGKRSLALVLAKALNCERERDDSCDKCETCRAIDNNRFPDVIEISAAKDVIQIAQMRFMKQIAYLKPMAKGKRVFIIDDAEKMNDESANSILKILEEPPLFTHIILTTSNPYLILPTIKSRCRTLTFLPVSNLEIEKLLLERDLPEDRAKIISLVARGNLDKALSLDWEDLREKKKAAWEIFMALLKARGTSSAMRRLGFGQRAVIREELDQLLELLSSFCRDFILIKEGGEGRFLINPDYEPALREIEKTFGLGRLLNGLAQIDFAISGLSRHLNAGLLVSSLFSNFGEARNV